MPPAWLGFEHCGNLVWMCESGLYVGPAVSQLKLPRVPQLDPLENDLFSQVGFERIGQDEHYTYMAIRQ